MEAAGTTVCLFHACELSAVLMEMRRIIISTLRGRRIEMSTDETGVLAFMDMDNYRIHASMLKIVLNGSRALEESLKQHKYERMNTGRVRAIQPKHVN